MVRFMVEVSGVSVNIPDTTRGIRPKEASPCGKGRGAKRRAEYDVRGLVIILYAVLLSLHSSPCYTVYGRRYTPPVASPLIKTHLVRGSHESVRFPRVGNPK